MVRFRNLPQVPIDRLPMLDALVAAESTTASQPFHGWQVLLIQHQFNNQIPLPKALIALGAKPSDVHWLDIPYTAHPVTVAEVERAGVPLSNLHVHDLRLDQDYDRYQVARAIDVLRPLLADGRPVLVLDDGAYALDALTTLQPDAAVRLAIVEQTTRGHIKCSLRPELMAMAQRFPVVDVARSRPKQRLEPAIIAHTIRAALLDLADARPEVAAARRCLVLGYGTIGRSLVEVLAREALPNCTFVIGESDPAAVATARSDGFVAGDLAGVVGPFDLVIGATGRRSFGPENVGMLADHAILVSVSSGSVEFAREEFAAAALDPEQADTLWRAPADLHAIHDDIELDWRGRRITICNGGFPLNLNGLLAAAPVELIQLTTTTMCSAALQAVGESRCGWVPLGSEREDWLMQAYADHLRIHGYQHPVFAS
ncbi:MAG: hypothetical protein NXI31_25395 [bacterium]|nr:hypothetical protein [bacterium]